jgi:hypothetical protein
MKKKTLAAIRGANSWHRRLDLANDLFPGTEFDLIFEPARVAFELARAAWPRANKALDLRQLWKKAPAISREIWQRLGFDLARLIETGDSETLHRVADALNKWKRHVPDPDPIRATIIALDGMGKSVAVRTPSGRLRKKRLPGPSVRDVLRNLRLQGIPTNEETPKLIRVRARELEIPLHGPAGRPKKSPMDLLPPRWWEKLSGRPR